jgi:curved DNA-binding protein CbpA
LQYHPDRDAGNLNATKNFQKLGEAYSTLSNPATRKVYDNYGKDGIDDDERDEPMSPEEAKDFYRQQFGEFETRPGGRAGFPYAEDLRESLLASELAKTLSFKLGQFKITFFLPLIIKKEINPILTVVEFVCTWIVILSCKLLEASDVVAFE